MKEKPILTIQIHGGQFSLNNVEITAKDSASFSELFNPDSRGEWQALADISDMIQYRGDITLPQEAFTSPDNRMFFQGLINRYRRHIAEHITDEQIIEAQREKCRLNNENRKIGIEPLIPEIERFIRQYRRDDPRANIEGTLEAVSQYLKDKHEINIETRTLRKYKIQEIIHRIKAEISAHTKKK